MCISHACISSYFPNRVSWRRYSHVGSVMPNHVYLDNEEGLGPNSLAAAFLPYRRACWTPGARAVACQPLVQHIRASRRPATTSLHALKHPQSYLRRCSTSQELKRRSLRNVLSMVF